MKKTIIIMGSLVLVAIIALILVIALKPKPIATETGRLPISKFEMTYEQFTSKMKKDLPKETMDKVKELYDEFQDADAKGKADIMNQLRDMDVYDQKGYAQALTKEELEKLVKERQQKSGD